MASQKSNIGSVGESIASRFLINHGFSVLEKNYRKKWGEVDIVARKNSIIHFIEVKSVSRDGYEEKQDDFMPEDNIHPWKIKRLLRTIHSYLFEKYPKNFEDIEWQLDAVVVVVNERTKQAKIRVIENITS